MSVESLIASSKKLALLNLKDKSDDEIRSIFSYNSSIACGSDQIAAAKAVGEMQACNEILEKREKQQNAREETMSATERAIENWPRTLHDRQMKAILKLPNASGHPGQLVAAILEEENGLDRDAIRSWSEELLAMDDKSYEALLDGLVKEGVLAVDKEGHYSLLRICTADLFPENPMEWAKEILAKNNTNISEEMLALLQHLADTGLPITEFQALDIGCDEYMKERAAKNAAIDPTRPPFVPELSRLTGSGVLSKTRIDGSRAKLYYFPMLGE